jgi:acyl carrier protein phosphodiesterase
MNFLAHAYLSFNNPKILVGNMISDFVKGAQKNNFQKDVRQGIMFHRDIDTFTDQHPATRKAREIFRADYRLYSGAIIDIIYDHFLANDHQNGPAGDLYQFSQDVYNTLEQEHQGLPDRFLHVLAYMKTENWLYSYKDQEGINRSLRGMVRRAAYLSDSTRAFELFVNHFSELQQCYDEFFPDVKQFAKHRLKAVLKDHSGI